MKLQPYRHLRRRPESTAWWLLVAMVLVALQPFIAIHFRDDGWEDEPGFRIRAVSATVQFEPDERPGHVASPETTVFVPSGASIDQPDAFHDGLAGLMALVLALLPLIVPLPVPRPPASRGPLERLHARCRAPPPTAIWRSLPPKTAPPAST
ncbi:hypothetical protein [Variovorax gossypii]